MRGANAYWVKYRMGGIWNLEQGIAVAAHSKAEAWEKAFYEAIPEKEGTMPYSAWVDNVTYNNGNQRFFNTCEGLGY